MTTFLKLLLGCCFGVIVVWSLFEYRDWKWIHQKSDRIRRAGF